MKKITLLVTSIVLFLLFVFSLDLETWNAIFKTYKTSVSLISGIATLVMIAISFSSKMSELFKIIRKRA